MSAQDALPRSPGLDATFARMVRVQTKLWNEVDSRVRLEHGEPLTHLTVLQVIVSKEDCRVRDLVDTLHITVGGASKVVDRLAQSGYVLRVVDPSDRRSSRIEATRAGLELIEHATPTVETVLLQGLAAHLSHQDLATLDSMLERLEAAQHASQEGFRS